MTKPTLEFSAQASNRINNGIVLASSLIYSSGDLVCLYDFKNSKGQSGVKTFKGHSGKITCLSEVKKNGASLPNWLVTGSADKTCIVWSCNPTPRKYAVLVGHEKGIVTVSAVLSSNGEIIVASSDSSSTIRIWNISAPPQIGEIITNSQEVNIFPHHCMALDFIILPQSDTEALLIGGTDMKLTLYARCGNEAFEKFISLNGHSDWIRSIKSSVFTDTHKERYGFKKGDLMVASAGQDKYIRIWKISIPNSFRANSDARVAEDTFEQQMLEAMNQLDGTQLSTKAHLINIFGSCYSIMLHAVLLGHDDWVFSINWEQPIYSVDPNGYDQVHQPMSLVSASADKSILIWNPDTHSESWIPFHRVGEVGGTTLGFYGACFSPNGNMLFSNGYNGAIHIWKKETDGWFPAIGISGHSNSVEDLAWDPSGTFLLSTSLDKTSRIFAEWKQNQSSWHEIARSQIHGYTINCCAFIDKYRYVSGADEKVVRIFEAPRTFGYTLENITEVKQNSADLYHLPDGASLPTLGLSNKAHFDGGGRDEADGAMASCSVSSQKEPPFEEHLLQNTLWPEIEKLYGHGYEIMSVATSPNGQLIATASKATSREYASIRIWSSPKWINQGSPLIFHSLTVTCMAFSKSNKFLLSAGRDRSWAIFDLEKCFNNPESDPLAHSCEKAHSRIIWDCCFTGDDKAFITVSRDKTIKIWKADETRNYKLLETIRASESATAVDVLPFLISDCYVFAVGFDDGAINVYHYSALGDGLRNQETLPIDDCHSRTVNSLKWRPGDNHRLQLASCSTDQSIRMFTLRR